MIKKNKLVLIESEMKGPKGHFLNNLIETTNNFNGKTNVYWILNKDFNSEGTYIPKQIKILKNISSNKFKRKNNRLFYIIEEIYLFILNLIQILLYSIYFIYKKNFLNFLKALKSNYFLLPRYFSSFYDRYKFLNLKKNDHVFFQTARRKDISLINFLIKIDENHPKFHIRVMLPPKIKFKGFFYFLKEIDFALRNKRAFVYLWSDYTYKLFINNSISKKGIYKSNIPWSFNKRKLKKKDLVVGFVGDARKSRGFHLLPGIIKRIQSYKIPIKFLIQFSKISDDLIKTKEELYELSKNNRKIMLIEKYCDYNDFTNLLKKIDIMPILHDSNEINTITSGTMYSCIPYEIPMVLPHGTIFMKKILKYDAIEYAKDQRDFSQKILKISENYNYYLKNMKLNSKILKKILQNDPLRKNIN